MFLALVAMVITLILVIGIHEAGHALVAYWFGVKIQRISIGFGRPLLSWRKKNGLEWVWALWPLGGTVLLLNSRVFPVKPAQYPYCFDKQAIWRRICILLAGSFANLITAWLALVLVFTLGIHYTLPIIQSVEKGSVAAVAGVVSGDQIMAINDQPTMGWREVGMELIKCFGNSAVSVSLKSANTHVIKTTTLNLSQVSFNQHKASLLTGLGIVPNLNAAKGLQISATWVDAIAKANASIKQILYFFLIILKQVIMGVIPFSVMLGPLGLFAVTLSSFTQGVAVFMYFIATLSLAVALINLFPIPVFDGGSILYALVEKIRGKPISIALEVLIHRLLFIAFCVLLAQLISNDLLRMYT